MGRLRTAAVHGHTPYTTPEACSGGSEVREGVHEKAGHRSKGQYFIALGSTVPLSYILSPESLLTNPLAEGGERVQAFLVLGRVAQLRVVTADTLQGKRMHAVRHWGLGVWVPGRTAGRGCQGASANTANLLWGDLASEFSFLTSQPQGWGHSTSSELNLRKAGM